MQQGASESDADTWRDSGCRIRASQGIWFDAHDQGERAFCRHGDERYEPPTPRAAHQHRALHGHAHHYGGERCWAMCAAIDWQP